MPHGHTGEGDRSRFAARRGRPLRIHFHTDNYWFSGSETTLLLLVDELSQRGEFDVSFTYRRWPAYEEALDLAGRPARASALDLWDPADAVAWARRRSEGAAVIARALVHGLPSARLALACSRRRLAALLGSRRPDVLHVNNGGYPGAISCNAAVLAAGDVGAAAVIYVVNNLAIERPQWRRRVDHQRDAAVQRIVSRFVTGSKAASVRLADELELTPQRLAVIPNAFRPSATVRSPRAAGSPVALLCVGRLEWRKGHAVLLQALATATATPWRLRIVGEGPERVALERLVVALGLDDRVELVGHADDVAAHLAEADVFIHPSVAFEDFPVAVLEAMSMGLPVVASALAGLQEQVVDGRTGLLVPPGDGESLRSAVLRLVDSPSQREVMGAQGRARAREVYAPASTVARYVELYEQVLEQAEAVA